MGHQRGFTLIEIMVVIVIIAILTTLGVLSIGTLGSDRQRQTEVEHFEDVAATALQEAQLEGRDFGIRIGLSGFQVYVYSPRRQRWETVPDDRLYAMHTLPPGLTFALSLEGRPVVLDELLEAPRDESIRRDPKVGDLNGFGSNTAILGKGLDNDTNDPTRRGFDTKPQVIFYASGDVSPYHLELRREAEPESWTIDQAIDGTIKALSPSQRALQLTGGP